MVQETATLAGYVAGLKFEDIPPEVLDRTKVLTLDFLGSAHPRAARCGIDALTLEDAGRAFARRQG